MSLSPEDVLNKKKSLNKRIDIENIKLDDVNVDDLKFNGNNYNQYINLVSLLENVSACQISDAYNSISKRSGTIQSIKSINNKKVWGSIFPCETTSDDWGTSAVAIDSANPGDILFFKVDGDDKAIWGELASKSAQSSGIKATVVYGSVRDLDALLYFDYPIFASNFAPNAGSPLGLGKLNQTIDVDGVEINPGDFFFGDENGIVVIPKKLFNQTMLATLAVKIKETMIVDKISRGFTLSEIAGLK